MNRPVDDEQFVARLAELDEAIAGGSTESIDDVALDTPDSVALSTRLQQNESCLRMLDRVRAAHDSREQHAALHGLQSGEQGVHGDHGRLAGGWHEAQPTAWKAAAPRA